MGISISHLDDIIAPNLSDLFPVSQGGVTYKETINQLATLLATAAEIPTFTAPTIADHISVFTNTTGNMAVDVPTAINGGNLQAGLSGTAGYLSSFPLSTTRGELRLVAADNAGDFVVKITNASFAQPTTLSIQDPGDATADFLLSKSLAGQSIVMSLTTATPANISLHIVAADINTLTSGALISLQGSTIVNNVSAGLIFGTIGSITANGILTSPCVISPIFGGLDLSGATINGAFTAGLYGALNGTAPIATDMTSTHGIVFVNATSAILNSQVFLTGDAQYALEVATATTYVATPGGATAGGALRTLKVRINGADYLLLAATSYT